MRIRYADRFSMDARRAAGVGRSVRPVDGYADAERAAALVAADMRPIDVREVWAAGGHSPLEAVRACLAGCRQPRGRAWVVLMRERPVMLFGVAPLSTLSDTGTPWMLATSTWDACMDAGLNLVFARRCRACLADMGRDFARLENYVHADNRRAARWLAWLGFRLDPPAPFGVRKELFMHFRKELR